MLESNFVVYCFQDDRRHRWRNLLNFQHRHFFDDEVYSIVVIEHFEGRLERTRFEEHAPPTCNT